MSFWVLVVIFSFVLNVYGLFNDKNCDEEKIRESLITLRLTLAVYLIVLAAAFYKLGW
jgi:hypothetical protein